jgi:hypothetical protein
MEIIQVIEIANYTWGFSWIGLLLAVISIILFIIFCIGDWHLEAGSIIIAILAFLSIACFATGKELEPTIRYQVVLNDSMTIKELYKKYEIIEQKGISYIIQEKEEVE